MNFKGRITEVIYRNEANDYTIAVFETDEIYFTVVGYMSEIIEQEMIIKGKMVNHDKYGEQFLIEDYEYVKPTTIEDIYHFLTYNGIAGLGDKTVLKVIDRFGEETLNIMNKNIDRLLEVNGIGKNRLVKIKESYSKIMSRQDSIMFLNKLGIKGKKVSMLINHYGDELVQTIKTNPYTLFFDIKDMSFNEVDAIANMLNFTEYEHYRIEAIIIYVIKSTLVSGSTYILSDNLIEIVSREYGVDEQKIIDCIEALYVRGYIRVVEEKIFLIQTYITINSIARHIARIHSPDGYDVSESIGYEEQKRSITFSDKQKSAIIKAFANKISIITGGPGTGKTTIIEAICDIAIDNSLKVKLAAPTGRAAVKMKNRALDKAKTIHRLLEYKFSEENNVLSFERNEDNPIVADIIIIDEVSMIDIFLFEKLMAALDDNTRVVLIGDSNQLPSVGPGKLLLDLIESDCIETTVLDIVYRQSGNSVIAHNSNLVVRGDTNLVEDGAQDYYVMDLPVHNAYRALEMLIKKSIPNKYDIDVFWDLQVLTPTKKGPLGTVELNRFLQSIINPSGPELNHLNRVFRKNDKVIMTKNSYNIEWIDNNTCQKNKGVFNGEIGVVEAVDVQSRELHILFEKYKNVTIKFQELDLIMHAYAITVHKAQGSEYQCVLLAMSNVSYLLANRSVIYTALTRAKQLFMMIGDKELYNNSIRNNKVSRRNTYLANLISSYFESSE